MSPAVGSAYPPVYPQSAYTVPAQAATPYQPGFPYAAPPVPPMVARIRLLLLAITILMIPNVALWLYSSILTGPFAEDGSFQEPAFYIALVLTMLIVTIPLATIPTLLSWQVGRGRNWARIVAIVLFGLEGPFCSCFGAVLPFTSLASESATSSPVMDAGLGIFSFVIGALSTAVAIMLFLPPVNRFFREMAQWRRAKAMAPGR
jgi:hypothetical protein